MWLKIIGSLSSEQWSDFCKQKEWVRARFTEVSVCGQNVLSLKEISVCWNKFKMIN
jgi:hypothetical protein